VATLRLPKLAMASATPLSTHHDFGQVATQLGIRSA